MSKYKFIISILILALNSSCLYADNITSRVERRFNAAVFRALDEYERNITLSNDDKKRNFRALFYSDTTKVYNDLMGLSDESYLTVDEYIKLLSEKTKTRKITIKNVRKNSVTDGDSIWIMDISLEKNIEYVDNHGIMLSANHYYKADYEIKITYCYDKKTQQCYISYIDGSINSSVPKFPVDYCVLEQDTAKEDRKIKYVKFQGDSIYRTPFNQALLSTSNQKALNYPDVDIRPILIKNSTNDRVLNIRFKQNHFRVRPKVEMSLGKFYNLTDAFIPDINLKSSDMLFGADVGYVIPSRTFVKWGFFTGMGLSISKMNFTKDSLIYDYSSPFADDDGDDYIRRYKLSNIKQDMKIVSVVIPLYLDVEFLFSRNLTGYVDVGGKVYLDVKSDVKSDMDAHISGKYRTYGNLIIDDINGFGTHHLGTDDLLDKELWSIISYDVFAGVGVRYYFNRKRTIGIDLGMQYQKAFRDSYISQCGYTYVKMYGNTRYRLTDEYTGYTAKLVSYEPEKGENVRNLTDAYPGKNHKHEGLRFNVGLIFKF